MLAKPQSALVDLHSDTVTWPTAAMLAAPVGDDVLADARWQAPSRSAGRSAGTYALDHHVERLAQDHALAQRLADGLRRLPQLAVQPVQTNMVFVELLGSSRQRGSWWLIWPSTAC